MIKTYSKTIPAFIIATLSCQASSLIVWDFENASEGNVLGFNTASITAASGITVQSVDGNNRIDVHASLLGTNSRKAVSTSDVANASGAIEIGDRELQLNPFVISNTAPNGLSTEDFLEFEVIPDFGNTVTDATVNFDIRAITGSTSTGGISAAGTVFTSTDGGTNWLSAGNGTVVASSGESNNVASHSISIPDITGNTIVRLALSDNSSASAGSATATARKALYLDDISLGGTIVPEPSAVTALMGVAALMLGVLRRRRV